VRNEIAADAVALACLRHACCNAVDRLNIFGFLAAEELRGRDKAGGSTGNYGIQVMILLDSSFSRLTSQLR
jgi:hypothetical protein